MQMQKAINDDSAGQMDIKVLDFMLKQSKARIDAAQGEYKAILKLKAQYLNLKTR